jgi:ketosteroid isomerase-like protein
MAEQHPNIIRYMRGIRAFNENDIATAMEVFSKDIVYRIAGRSPIGGEYRGFDEFGRALRRFRELSGGTLVVEPKVVLADDKALMVYAHVTAEREGKKIDIDHAYLYLFNDDGKVIEGRVAPVDLYAFDEFWS